MIPIISDIEIAYFSNLGDGVVPRRSLFDVSNSLIYAKPRSAVFERAIEAVVLHCREEY